VNENSLPKTWEKFMQLGQAYKKAGMPGFTMHLGNDPGQSFNLFICGSGHDDVWLNNTPTCEIKDKIESFEKIVKVYAGSEGFWDKDAISEGFAEMYNKILSSSVGMFRVGNWNAGPWDKPDSGAGEYVTTTWPAMEEGDESGLVLLNTRGLAMPKNSKNKEAAKIFLSYVLKTAPQTKSFETMGSCIDLSVVDTTKLTKNQKIFFDPEVKLFPIDTYVAEYEFYPELNDIYEKGLNRAINAKEEDVRTVLLDLNTQIDKAISANK
jgi:ABC-type sugar transport system, periplasmic component